MALQFDIRYVSPRQFLDRFQHIMNLDSQQNELHEQICNLAHQFCLTSLKDKVSLELRPSTIAAASILLAINISKSSICETVGLLQLDEINSHQESSLLTPSMDADLSPTSPTKAPKLCSSGPLKLWSSAIANITQISATQDIQPVYITLLSLLNKSKFGGLLSEDQSIFVHENP